MGQGEDLLRFFRDKAPLTAVVMMTARKSFDLGVSGFRLGAADVVVKEPATVPYLVERTTGLAADLRATNDRNALLDEASQIHEEFLRRMRDLDRTRLDLEDRVLGREAEELSGATESCDVLVVDDDQKTLSELRATFGEADGWRFAGAHSGGEALDAAPRLHPQIVLVKDTLPDLPGKMVVKSIKEGEPDAVTLLYTPPEGDATTGGVSMIEGSRIMELVTDYADVRQLIPAFKEIREGVRQKGKERRYLLAFRQSQYEFLRRYNSLRQRIRATLEQARRDR